MLSIRSISLGLLTTVCLGLSLANPAEAGPRRISGTRQCLHGYCFYTPVYTHSTPQIRTPEMPRIPVYNPPQIRTPEMPRIPIYNPPKFPVYNNRSRFPESNRPSRHSGVTIKHLTQPQMVVM